MTPRISTTIVQNCASPRVAYMLFRTVIFPDDIAYLPDESESFEEAKTIHMQILDGVTWSKEQHLKTRAK